jgi:hypothetical protein
MVNKVLNYLPNIFTAALILAVGWFVARIVRNIVTNFLAAVGADQMGQRVGLTPVFGGQTLSGVVGLLAYILILVPVLVSALDALALEAITRPTSNMLNTILNALPDILPLVSLSPSHISLAGLWRASSPTCLAVSGSTRFWFGLD